MTFGQVATDFLATDREGQPPVRVIKAEAGLGKSTAVLAEIRKQLRDNPALRFLYMVPSLDLADELATKALADFGIEARVMRGRSQRQPNSTATMCAKSDIAEALATQNVSVTTTLCRSEDDQGNVSECPFYATCPYIAQLQAAKAGGLVIASHQYLSVRMEALKDVDWLIIDESFWQVLCAQKLVDLGRFTTYRGVGDSFRGRKGESRPEFDQRTAAATEKMIDAVARFANVVDDAARADRQPTLADFAAEGFTAEECDDLATLEYSRITTPEITAGMDEDMQRSLLEKAHVQEAYGFVRIWKILAAELRSGRQGESHGLVIEWGVLDPKTNKPANFIHAHWSRDPRFKEVPTLIIDADADPEIIGRFYPTAETVQIAAEWQNVEIVQVTDKTGSAQSLKGERRRDDVYNTALDMADRLASVIGNDPARRPLLVSQKAVIQAYSEAGDLDRAPFDTAWFGNTRGKDQWKQTAGIVVAGRIEPSPQALEAMARSIWFGSEEALTFMEPNAEGRFMLPKCQHWTTAKSGQSATVAVSYHPDRRADRVLRQVREAELMQALARVRPIHRGADNPCQIIVLTNVPLPIEADRFATWNEVVPDRHDLMRLAGFIPEKSNDAADVFPSLWTSATAVRIAASRRAERAFPAFAGGVSGSIY
ncbi:DEAD/DEAH box helicase family protein, partial [Rhizobiaceae bacterium CRRU44]